MQAAEAREVAGPKNGFRKRKNKCSKRTSPESKEKGRLVYGSQKETLRKGADEKERRMEEDDEAEERGWNTRRHWARTRSTRAPGSRREKWDGFRQGRRKEKEEERGGEAKRDPSSSEIDDGSKTGW
jgi:hypothetical protein